MIKCNLDCFNCIKPDCDVDFIDWNSVKCKRWYEKNREKKLAYQKAYNKRKRQNKPVKKVEEPRVTEILSFKELAELTEV